MINRGGNTSRHLISAESRGFGIIKPTGEENNNSCEVTWVQQIDVKGNIPPKIMEKQIPRALHVAFQVRDSFHRDDEIDRIERDNLMAIMQNGYDEETGEVYDESETQLIEEVQKQIRKASDDTFRPLNR